MNDEQFAHLSAQIQAIQRQFAGIGTLMAMLITVMLFSTCTRERPKPNYGATTCVVRSWPTTPLPVTVQNFPGQKQKTKRGSE